MNVTIYHNPRCSKSRETLKLIQQQNIEPIIIEYLKNPPDADQLDNILTLLKLNPRQLMRRKEVEYKENGLEDDSLNRQALIHAMIVHPKLIERPIVLANNKAAIGRPPEAVLSIL